MIPFVQYKRLRAAVLIIAMTVGATFAPALPAIAAPRISTCNEVLSPISMAGEYEGENEFDTTYVAYITKEKERREHQWKIREGKFVHAISGKPVNTNDNGATRAPYDSYSRIPFVISPKFRVYGFTESKFEALSKGVLSVHHSSLLAGQPVGFAGEVEIADGEVLQFTNRSGHYLPDEIATIETIKLLKRRGLSFQKTQFQIEGLEDLLDNPEYRRFLLSLMPEQILLEEALKMLERGGYTSYAQPQNAVLNRLRKRVLAERLKLNGQSPLVNRFKLVYAELPMALKRFVDSLNTAP